MKAEVGVAEATVKGRSGTVKLGWTGAGVCRVVLLSREEGEPSVEYTGDKPGGGVMAAVERMCAYLDGDRVEWDGVPLDCSGVSAFRRAVWGVTRAIPYGQVRTYGWIARQLGRPRAARAVGSAMAANPFPIIVPCHRIVGSDFRLGHFSSGADWKAHLHNIEGVKLRR